MFGFFKKNDEQEKALAEKTQLELKTLADEIASLKMELKESHELIELRTAFHEPRSQDFELEKSALNLELQKLQSEKDQLQERFNALEKDRKEIVDNRQLLWEEYQKLDALRSTFDPGLGDRANQLQAEKDELQERFSALQKDRSEIVEARQFLWEEYQKLEISRNEWQERFTKLEQEFNDVRAQGISSLVSAGASFDGQHVNIEQILEQGRKLKIQIESLDQENNFLLIQIRQNQDELDKLSVESKTNKELNHSLSAKWHRLEKRFPNYIDYGGLEIVSVDGVAATPKIIWKITDYSKADFALPEFYFQTTLQNGQAGISIIDGGDEASSNQALIPVLLAESQEQRGIFIEYGLSEWNKISAACDVLEQLIINNGAGLGQAEGFDLSFWKSSLATLVQSIQKLPKILRFDRIRLKRELVNPNYEHLWLEFYDVQLDSYRLPKFEMRLGAALVQSEGFSRFPKIEIPLVNGKDKPFESWYPESSDDQGPKLELRFSLDKEVFDLGVFSKLGPVDQRLIQSFVYRLPAILNHLSKSKVSIHRQWQDWYGFAQATALVMQNQLNQARALKEADANQTVQTSAKDEDPAKKSISVVSVTKKGSASKDSLKNLPTAKKSIAVKKKTASRSAR
jgi:predicted nuclease with TOPRIM domain